MANAFDAIAPGSGASTSCSKKPYDVFINHRGEDVKRTVASIIYNMLDLMGVPAFLDEEELEVGDSFPQAIEDAMRGASVHIAIFSPTYAESPWCLEELSFMLKLNVTIIPVFYGVDPSDLRHVAKGKGKYAHAFAEHKRKKRYTRGRIKEWEEALTRVSNVSGCKLDEKCDEGKVLREILESALQKKKKKPLDVAKFPVGLDEAVKDFNSEIGKFLKSEVGFSTEGQNVQIIGIVGMGGSGKTTLAKELFNRRSPSMRRASFLSNVKASKNNLHNLQKNLLEDFGIKHQPFHTTDAGIEILKSQLRSMTVLIVLDDVDDAEPMHALLPTDMMDNLGQGSFIIVTTREKAVLQSCGISSVYPMKLLHPVHAKQLFCRHAFFRPFSKRGCEYLAQNYHSFQDLIERFVKACHGLPLSLKVLGAMLNPMSKEDWQSQLQKISKLLPHEIVDCLKLSYDALDEDEQKLFLDIACFFVGEEKRLAVAIWEGSDWSGDAGCKALINKCLVELDEEGNIQMHDHLRDLGRKIARDISPSRIWNDRQISFQGGRTLTRGIVAAKIQRTSLFGVLTCHSSHSPGMEHYMKKIIEGPSLPELQLLAVRGDDFSEKFASSLNLVWLRWCDFNGTSLPPACRSLLNLRALELYNAENLEELWQKNEQPLLQLRELILVFSGAISNHFRLPSSMRHLERLKKLTLSGNRNQMGRLQEDFCLLGSLEILELKDVPWLLSLPDNFGDLKNLRVLVLSDAGLRVLPDSFKQLRLLQLLDISCCHNLMSLNLHVMTELQVLRITGCRQLQELPHLTTLVSLRELKMRDTALEELPYNIGELSKLETLVIGGENLMSLPLSLVELPCLTTLEIYGCKLFECLPEAVRWSSSLRSLEISSAHVEEFDLNFQPCAAAQADAATGPALARVALAFTLIALALALGAVDGMEKLFAAVLVLALYTALAARALAARAVDDAVAVDRALGRGCNLTSLEVLKLSWTRVRRISISDECCPSLQTLYLFSNEYLTEIETLPGNVRDITVEQCPKMKNMRGIGRLQNLQSLKVLGCPDLEEFPCPTYMHRVREGVYLRI